MRSGSRTNTPRAPGKNWIGPPLKGMPRINAFPGTDAPRKALHVKRAKKPNPFAPISHKVKDIVPNKFVAKLGQKSPALRWR